MSLEAWFFILVCGYDPHLFVASSSLLSLLPDAASVRVVFPRCMFIEVSISYRIVSGLECSRGSDEKEGKNVDEEEEVTR
jgi:hypothetical protein